MKIFTPECQEETESLYFIQQNWVCINIAEHCISSIWGTMQREKNVI